MAEQDMELIRTKRATSTAGGTASAGQPKSKYRKRSVSFIPAPHYTPLIFLSVPLPLANVTRATFAKLPNGEEAPTVQEHYAMHAVCVRLLALCISLAVLIVAQIMPS